MYLNEEKKAFFIVHESMLMSITHEPYNCLALVTISEDEKSPLKSHNMGATQEAVTLFFLSRQPNPKAMIWADKVFSCEVQHQAFQVPRPRKAKTCLFWFEVPPPFPFGLLFTR